VTAAQAGAVATGDTRIPTQDENDALAGTSGSPSSSNKYATNADARLSDARTPTAHKDSHKSGGGDAFAASDILEATVKRLQTTTGPTTLAMAGVADGEYLKRSGASLVGGVPGGAGDVVGPASSVDNNVVFFNGTSGKLIKDSGLTLSGSNTGDEGDATATVKGIVELATDGEVAANVVVQGKKELGPTTPG